MQRLINILSKIDINNVDHYYVRYFRRVIESTDMEVRLDEFFDNIKNNMMYKANFIRIACIEPNIGKLLFSHLYDKDYFDEFFDEELCNYINKNEVKGFNIFNNISCHIYYLPKVDIKTLPNFSFCSFRYLNNEDSMILLDEMIRRDSRYTVLKLKDYLRNFSGDFVRYFLINKPEYFNNDYNFIVEELFSGLFVMRNIFNKDIFHIFDKLGERVRYKLINYLCNSDKSIINSDLMEYVIKFNNPYYYRIITLYSDEVFLDFESKRRRMVKSKINTINEGNRLLDFYQEMFDKICNKKSNYLNYECILENYDFINLIKVIDKSDDYKDNLYEFVCKLNDDYIDKCILDYLFNDLYHNVVCNLNEIINYPYSKSIIGEEFYAIYKKLVNIKDMNYLDKIKLFNSLRRINLREVFYDHYRLLKSDSYKRLINSSIKFNHDNKVYNKELSDKYGVDVYYLDGEKFFALVSCLSITNLPDYVKGGYKKPDFKTNFSLSLISDKNIKTFLNPTCNITLVFDNPDTEQVLHVFHTDSYSNYDEVSFSRTSDCVNELMTPDMLMDRTNAFNEIVIKDNSGFKPTGYIVFDKISDTNVNVSKKLGLPILLINSKRYYMSDSDIDYDDYPEYIYNDILYNKIRNKEEKNKNK